jgi:hypothetical protein
MAAGARTGFGHSLESDPLDTLLTRASFWPSLGHYARLHGVCPQHLADTLRFAGQPGVPVTARLVFDTAAALAAGGFGKTPIESDDTPQHILDRELAEHAAANPGGWRRGKGSQPRGTRMRARPAARHSLGR